jgi:hypothetical protein
MKPKQKQSKSMMGFSAVRQATAGNKEQQGNIMTRLRLHLTANPSDSPMSPSDEVKVLAEGGFTEQLEEGPESHATDKILVPQQ